MPIGWYVSKAEVAALMLDFLSGRRISAPYGARFECTEDVATGLRTEAPKSEFEPPWPFSAGVLGSFSQLTSLPIVTSQDLGDGEWRLVAPIAGSVIGGEPFGVAEQVVAEGHTRDGKPTGLAREYWANYWTD
jgi:hypothetical protein